MKNLDGEYSKSESVDFPDIASGGGITPIHKDGQRTEEGWIELYVSTPSKRKKFKHMIYMDLTVEQAEAIIKDLQESVDQIKQRLSTGKWHYEVPVLTFSEGEWFQIQGRGLVFSTKMPSDYQGSLMNEIVDIQGKLYDVRGVELQAKNDSSLYKGRPVGLLVRPRD